jgi:tetratricopeptide (TPR) repeat protein
LNPAEVTAAIREALACFQSKDFARAEALYRQVVAAAPDAKKWSDLGVILKTQGKHEEAAAAYQRAIELDPKDATTHYNLGNLLRDLGQVDGAVASYRRAVGTNPRLSDAHINLGRLLIEKGRTDEALSHMQAAGGANPRSHDVHNNLGIAFHRSGRMKEAIQSFRQAIELKPDYIDAYGNLGQAHAALYEEDEACASLRKAVELDPLNPGRHVTLGYFYRNFLKLDDALACFRHALELQPTNPDYHVDYSLALLLKGELTQGWHEYEWRWHASEQDTPRPASSGLEWNGEDISGKRILLYHEQGFGDVIQFIRYAPLVARRGAQVAVLCQPELVRLVRTVDGIHEVIADGETIPPVDHQCALLSLPRVFKTDLDTIPNSAPYVRADPNAIHAWATRMGKKSGPRVGLIWAGTAENTLNHKRSCSLSDFGRLAIKGVEFHSLQKGEPAAEAKTPPPGMTLVDWTEELNDFADTAALLANLDLLITVDTAGAHLAGALGKPVWLLNRFESEWRWLVGRNDSPWYPSMRIYSQVLPGSWREPLTEVASQIASLVTGSKKVY